MAEDLPSVPEELVEAGAAGHLVVLVGAGVSRGSGLPDWQQLIRALYDRARTRALTSEQREQLDAEEEWFLQNGQNLTEKPSFLRKVLGVGWLQDALQETLAGKGEPNATHRALADIPGATFLTTNYDSLLEQAIVQKKGVAPKVVLLSDVEGVRDLTPGQVFKMHGDLASPKTVVLTVRDYFEINHRAAPAWKAKVQQLLQKPYQVVMVGYGYRDPDIRQMLDELRGVYHETLPGPYWVQKKSARNTVQAEDNNLRPVWLTDFDRELVPWLESLASAIRRRAAQAPVMLRATAYVEENDRQFKKDQERADELFKKSDYEDARNVYQTMLDQASRLSEGDPDREMLRRRVATCRVNVGICLANLQQTTEAREVLLDTAKNWASSLPPPGVGALAGALAMLGERESARGLLAAIPAESDEPRVRETRELLQILEGHIPEREPESIVLRLELLNQRAERGQLAQASRKARELLAKQSDDPLSALICARILQKALAKSIWEEPGADWIPIEERSEVVAALERALAIVEEANAIPAASERILAELKADFFRLTEDHESLKRVEHVLQQRESSEAPPLGAQGALFEASRLAEAGKLEEALQKVPQTDHPWTNDFHRLNMFGAARRYHEALQEALRLVELWPGRAPIERVVASLLLRASRPDEAVPHARAALAALPGFGTRLLVARCLLKVGEYRQAQDCLAPLATRPDAEVLHLRAYAAEHLDPNGALQLWERYLAQASITPAERDPIKLRRLALLFSLGKMAQAADDAWQLYCEAKDRFDVRGLIGCAQFISVDRSTAKDERSRRLLEILKTVRARFPNDPEAERFRLALSDRLELPEEENQIDVEKLVELDVLKPISLDDLREMMQERAELGGKAHAAYAAGMLSFESFCELTHAPIASQFLAMVRGGGSFSAPPSTADRSTWPNLNGQKLLLGHLELLLLQRLGLFSALRAALGPGRLILFHDIEERVAQEAAELELGNQPVELARLERAEEVLRRDSKVRFFEAPKTSVDDAAWAAGQGIPLLSAHESVRRLVAKGVIEHEKGERLLQSFGPAEKPDGAAAETPPRTPHLITATTFWMLVHGELLEHVLELTDRDIVVGPNAHEQMTRRLEDLQSRVEAAELALALQRSVGAGIAERWILGVDRPNAEDIGLPALRDSHRSDPAEKLLREPLARTLAFFRQLEKDPELQLLNADYSRSAPLGANRASVGALAWRSPEHFLSVATRLHRVEARSIHVPALIRSILPESQARKKREELAELGFVDALGAEELLDLHQRFDGLEKERPSRLLDRVEWMVRQVGHVGAPLAHLSLSGTYGHTIWRAFFRAFPRPTRAVEPQRQQPGEGVSEHEVSEREATSLSAVLLERAERIDQRTRANLLEMVFGTLALIAANDFRESLVETENEERLSWSNQTAPGRMWAAVRAWTGLSVRRRAALERAVRRALVDIQSVNAKGMAKHIRAEALLLSEEERLGLSSPVSEAFSIVSGTWDAGRAHAGVEPYLRGLAGSLGQRSALLDEGHLQFIEEDGTPLSDAVAPEAILLRAAAGEGFRELAAELARRQGPHDGRAYALLMALVDRPDDAGLRSRYARMTVVAPWRLVREDPLLVTGWAWRGRFGPEAFPGNIEDLCALLSEPHPPHLGSESITSVLLGRGTGEGAWARRSDRLELMEQACAVPGLVASILTLTRVSQKNEEAYRRDVAAALERMANADDVLAGRLAGDLIFLRAAAARRPYVRLPSREVDLREELPARLLALLRSAVTPGGALRTVSPQEADAALTTRAPESALASPGIGMSLAAAETALLSLCLGVVRALSGHDQLSHAAELWLTYRLCQWLCAQMETLPAPVRRAHLAELRHVARSAEAPVPSFETLPPPFARDGSDYRLATLLASLHVMEELPRLLPESQPETPSVVPRSVSSPDLEKILCALAARPLSREERQIRARRSTLLDLDWRSLGPIPDLALTALLHLNNEAFFELPAEARRRWILDLPGGPDSAERADSGLARGLVLVLTCFAGRLSHEEMVAFEERLQTLEILGEGTAYRLLGFAALCKAGRKHLEDRAKQLLLENLGHEFAPVAFESLMIAVSFADPQRLGSVIEQVFERLPADSAAEKLLPFVLGVARVVLVGNPESASVAREALRRAAEWPALRADDKMKEVLETLGMLTRSEP